MARVRSPNYPAISLGEAIERIKLVHKAEQHIPAAREVIAKDLGYGGLNGASLKVLSALIKYGLLDEAGDKLKVSERAINILYAPNDATRNEAIKAAASAPALFADFLQEWDGSIPSDENIRHYLLRRNFAQSAIDGVIHSFRETMDLVTQQAGGYPIEIEPVNAGRGQERPPMQPHSSQQPQNRGGKLPYETTFTPASGEPFRVTFTGNGIDIGGRITSPERADELIRAIEALKVLLRPVGSGQPPTGREGLEDLLGEEPD